MNCPSCDRPRVEGDECPYCGVIYARAHPRRAVAPPPPAPDPRPAGAAAPSSRWRTALWTSLALVVAGVTTAVALRRPARPAAPASAAPADAVPAATRAGATPDPDALPAASPAEPFPSALAPDPAAPAPSDPPACARLDPSDIQRAAPPPVVSAEWHEGWNGYRRALDEQASARAPLLVLFYTDWCPHCRRFIAEVIPSPEARRVGERIVKAKVNAEGDADERALAARHGVRSYPTLLLFAAGDAAPVRVAGTSSPASFADGCERALPDPALERLRKGAALARGGDAELAAAELKAAASSADAALAALALDHLGDLALRTRCFATAARIYGRVLDLDAGYGGGRAHHLRAFARLRSGDRSGALEDADEACRRGFQESCRAADALRGSPR